MNPNIKIEGDLVTKKYSKEANKEFNKAEVLYNIADANNFLSVEPIILKNIENKIIFKYLYSTQSIRKLYRDYLVTDDNKELILNVTYEAGKVLACIHSYLILETKTNWFPPKKFIDALICGVPSNENTQSFSTGLGIYSDLIFPVIFTSKFPVNGKYITPPPGTPKVVITSLMIMDMDASKVNENSISSGFVAF